jgi:uncharacterized protein YybS (DUF2232 family)
LPIKPSGNQTPLAMVETAFFSSTACLLCLIGNYLPISKSCLKPLLALPLALVYLRWGKRAGWMSVAVTGLLLLVLIGPIYSILFIIPNGLLGIQLGAFWRWRVSWGWSFSVGGALDAIGSLLRIYVTSITTSENLWGYATNRVGDILRLSSLVEPTDWAVQLMIVGLLFINGMSSLLMTHYVALFLFNRVGAPISNPPKWVKF